MTDTIEQWLELILHFAANKPLIAACILAATTFASEDGSLIIGGLLVGSGHMPEGIVIPALATGIIVGDIGLYILGWAASHNAFIASKVPIERAIKLKNWLSQRQSALLFLSRFTPGTRFITYVSFGFLRMSLARFSTVLSIAACLWVTVMVLFISEIQAAVQHMGPYVAATTTSIIAITVLFGLPRLLKWLRPTSIILDHESSEIRKQHATSHR
ncbi:DedA family protein [Kordiimonas pumila]|uniref:DedA family protein n=1 Tax=Kordiimonas pumila TaxID=2161677 RepID=A0ABV7D636_9PROT|nr:VTT domain-containing protein [Kordiimonas pumila]